MSSSTSRVTLTVTAVEHEVRRGVVISHRYGENHQAVLPTEGMGKLIDLKDVRGGQRSCRLRIARPALRGASPPVVPCAAWSPAIVGRAVVASRGAAHGSQGSGDCHKAT